MGDPHPAAYRAIWQDKPVLRAVYEDYYARMAGACRPGRTLEVGGGAGNMKAFLPDVVSTDILTVSWLDAAADAEALPFGPESFSNIVMLDVLHHIPSPCRFFAEASRVLRPGGRIVMIEPAMSPVGRFFFTHLHPEPVDLTKDPFAATTLPGTRRVNPYEGNQAIPHLLFKRHRKRFEAEFPRLRMVACEEVSLFAYPLSGGFRSWSLIPAGLVAPLLRLEAALSSVLAPLMAFRLFVVLENQ